MFNPAQHIKSICKERNIHISALERTLGFSNGYLNPKKLKKLPYERAVKIAEYLNLPVEQILNGEEKKPTPLWVSGLSNEALEVAAAYDRAAKKDQDTIRFILADCLPRTLAAREGDGVAPTEEEMSGVTVAGEDSAPL